MRRTVVITDLFRYALVVLALVSAFGGLAGAPAAYGQSVGVTCQILQPAATSGKDAYLKQDKVDERRGGDPELRVKTESGKLNRALVQFDLSALPANATVISATLSLFVKDATGGAVTISAHRLTNAWNEAQVTWNARDKAASQLWSSPGGDYDASASASAIIDNTKNVWRSWNLTSLVATWLSNPASNYGVALVAPVTNPKTEKKFKSSDDGSATQRPKLEVCYRPVVEVSPNRSVDGVAGQIKTLAHTVTVGNLTSAINLSASSSLGWDTRIYNDVNGNGVRDSEDSPISATPVIGPNTTYPLLVQVDVPLNAPAGAIGIVTIGATAANGGASDTAHDHLRVSGVLSVGPDNSRYLSAGAVAFYAHTITNNSAVEDCVNTSATSSLVWPLLLWSDDNGNGVKDDGEAQVSNPSCIAAGDSKYLLVEVQAPANAAAGSVDQTVLTAVSSVHIGKSSSAVDRTSIFVDSAPQVDGRVDDVYRTSPSASEACYAINGVPLGKLSTYVSGDSVYLALAVEKSIVDNSYGTGAVGWPGAHRFDDLKNGDLAQFQGFDANGDLVLDIKMDYISDQPSALTDRASLGVSGGDGQVTAGNAAHVTAWETSIANNLNSSGYCANNACGLITNSPATDAFYTPNPTYPNWSYDVVYELKISKSAFGAAGYGSFDVASIVASPNKLGPGAITPEPSACPGEIGDAVWHDLDGDGVQDGGEPGIDNVQLRLYKDDGDSAFDTSSDILARTYTSSNGGKYLFSSLEPNDYFVEVIDATIPAGYQTTTYNDPTALISLAPGERIQVVDFGYLLGASIGDVVWNDLNQNGVQDSGEPGVAGAIVKLYSGAGALLDATASTTSGAFSFLNRPAGSYQLEIDLPAGYSFTLANQGADPLRDSDIDPSSSRTPVFTTSAGVAELTRDIGLVGVGAIGDFVWYDSDGDGVQDVGEPGIANVTLDLLRDGVKIAGATSGADGGYLISHLGPGAYVVDVTDLNGVLNGLTRSTGNQSQPDPTSVINLGASELYKDADFGYRIQSDGSAIIGDFIWYDANANGRQEAGEAGVAGVQVCATASGGSPICAVTSSSGSYRISVPPGVYAVAPASTPAGLTPSTATSLQVRVATGEQFLRADFGYDSNALGVIGNLIFLDADRNGAFNGGDSALPGVTVDLIRDDNNSGVWDAGEPVVATAVSGGALDGNGGNYLFSAVRSGAYLVYVGDASGLLSEYRPAAAAAHPAPVVLADGQSVLSADFGFTATGDAQGAPDGAIGSQVWIESDGDGLFAPASGDLGQAGVTVELYKDGLYFAKTTTGASGRYAFLGLAQGAYSVNVVDDFNVLSSYRSTSLGANQGQDNQNQVQPYAVALTIGRIDFSADFGYALPAAIGDYLWYDTDADGRQDIGELGIGNVTIGLYRQNSLVLSTTTDIDGGYLFANLAPGIYTVDVIDANGLLAGLTHTTGPQSQADPTAAINLTAGQVQRDADFGYVRNSAGAGLIGGAVWFDGNANGLRDPGEPGSAGVQVCATPEAGGPTCATTDANGAYRMLAPAGVYSVQPTNPPAGATATSFEPHGPFGLIANQQYLDASFGYGRSDLGTIGGTVWHDIDQDGVLAGEAGLPGVSVSLILDSNNDDTWNAAEPIVATATSDAYGNYLFSGLPAGEYLVRVSDTQNVLDDYSVSQYGADQGQDNNNQPQPHAVSLAAGDSDLSADFGYRTGSTSNALGMIGNQLWYEMDGNGIFAAHSGDIGVAGVTIALLQNGQPIATTTSGAGGRYVFTSLAAGAYQLQVTDAVGIVAGAIRTVNGSNPGEDQHNQAQPYAVSLEVGGVNMTADFGYTRPGAIGDLVWYDADGDGIQNVGEPGLANVTLDLYRDNQKVASTTSGAGGGYLFSGLPPGLYSVDVTDANGVLGGMTHVVANQSQTDPSAGINLAEGEVNKDADFSYVREIGGNVLISDRTWIDANSDGKQQPGEVGLAGVQVCATPTAGGSAICAISNAAGNYWLVAPPGDYAVTATPPGGYTATSAALSLSLVAGSQRQDADFGFTAGNLIAIGDLVYLDANRDGAFNGGDQPLVNVSVDLIADSNGNQLWDANEPVIGTAVSAATVDANNRNALFPAVPPGSYLTRVSDVNAVLTDFMPSPSQPAAPGVVAMDATAQSDLSGAALTTGQANNSFGFVQADRVNSGVIGNLLWFENDANGVFDPANGDIGQHGVTIQLNGEGGYSAMTTTGAGGGYSFTGLPAGNYTVRVADDFSMFTGYTVTVPGPNQTLDNHNKIQPHAVALADGGVHLIADFGYTGLGVVQGTVYLDLNGDMVQGLDEPGLANVLLCLFADDDNNGTADSASPLMCTHSDASGGYQLYVVNLPQTRHFVLQEQDPSGLVSSTPNQLRVTLNPVQGSGVADGNNFGDTVNTSYTLVKELVNPGSYRPGDAIAFRIRVTNTGSGYISVLPLSDVFDPNYMVFNAGAAGNSPPPDEVSANTLRWHDVTGAGQLAPNGSLELIVNFIGLADTTPLPNSATVNVATVANGLVDPDGPLGALGDLAPMATQSANASVGILAPTGTLVDQVQAEFTETGAVLRWVTLDETTLAGFNVLRSVDGGEFVQANSELIVAQRAGEPVAAQYEFVDSAVNSGQVVVYRLMALLTNGAVLEVEAAPTLTLANKIFLPLVNR